MEQSHMICMLLLEITVKVNICVLCCTVFKNASLLCFCAQECCHANVQRLPLAGRMPAGRTGPGLHWNHGALRV